MIAAVIALSTAATASADLTFIDRVVFGAEELPSLVHVQQAAVEALVLPDDEEIRGQATRARLRGLLPRLEVSVLSDLGLDVRDSFAADPIRTTTDRRGLGLNLSARFELGDLIFSDFELRAQRGALARSAAIRLTRERVTRWYFERLALLAEEKMIPLLSAEIEAAALDGLLDGETGGAISAHRGGRR